VCATAAFAAPHQVTQAAPQARPLVGCVLARGEAKVQIQMARPVPRWNALSRADLRFASDKAAQPATQEREHATDRHEQIK